MTGRTLGVEYTKWDGGSHWHYQGVHVGDDPHGIWLITPAGWPVQRGNEASRVFESPFITLIPVTGWWSAVFNTGEGDHVLYVDINTEPEWDGDIVTMIDLDLDVSRTVAGETVLHDEDEFEEHRVRYRYPEDVVDRARTVTAERFLAVQNRVEPFDHVGPGWLRQGMIALEGS